MSSKEHSFLVWKRKGRTHGRVRSFGTSRQKEMKGKLGLPQKASSRECWPSRCCPWPGKPGPLSAVI